MRPVYNHSIASNSQKFKALTRPAAEEVFCGVSLRFIAGSGLDVAKRSHYHPITMPVTPAQFRRMALAFPETEERSHMNHPDFRVRGKIFATLAYPNQQWAMVKLTPDQQEVFVADDPKVFSPVNGAWGRQGCTLVQLKSATQKILRRAIVAAWLKAAPKSLAKQFEAGE